jgi:hypothetical protein
MLHTGEHETIVERSIKREVRERLQDTAEDTQGDGEQRARLECDVRQAILLSRMEDEV